MRLTFDLPLTLYIVVRIMFIIVVVVTKNLAANH